MDRDANPVPEDAEIDEDAAKWDVDLERRYREQIEADEMYEAEADAWHSQYD